MSHLNIVIVVALALSLNAAPNAEAQGNSSSPAKRVESFRRPTEMRVKPPADAPSGPNVRRATQACPATLDDMCQKFWAFAGQSEAVNDIETPRVK